MRKSTEQQLGDFFESIENSTDVIRIEASQVQWLQSLTAMTVLLKLKDPEIVARQLLFMVNEACKHQQQAPESRALAHAHLTARALLAVQKRKLLTANSRMYAMAASFFLIFGISSMMLSGNMQPREHNPAANRLHESLAIPATGLISANPKRLAEMHSHRERMRQGTCNFPEALMLDEADRSIYLKTVVYGNIPHDIKEQQITARLMESVRCNYAPMLMKNSIG